jgi:murein DD-endopeptidase MepM/ murein hydrolase activator NlpD
MLDLDDRSEFLSAPECRGPRRRSSRTRVAGLIAALTVLVVTADSGPVSAATCLLAPVDAPVTRAFEAPPCPWCAGHRGLTYAVAPGTAVRAAAAGEVTFSGLVVDVRYVVVRHGDGLLATYGGVESTTLSPGDRVAAGATIGRSGPELYFGLRTAPDTYIDPEPLIGELVVQPYLVPTDGSPQRPPPAPVLRCT